MQKVAQLCAYPFHADITGWGAALTRGEIAEGPLRAIKTYWLPAHKVQNAMIPTETGTVAQWGTVCHNQKTWW